MTQNTFRPSGAGRKAHLRSEPINFGNCSRRAASSRTRTPWFEFAQDGKLRLRSARQVLLKSCNGARQSQL